MSDAAEELRQELSTYEDAGVIGVARRMGIATGPGVTREDLVDAIVSDPRCAEVLEMLRAYVSKPITGDERRAAIRPVED